MTSGIEHHGELNIWQVYEGQGFRDRLSWLSGLCCCLHTKVIF